MCCFTIGVFHDFPWFVFGVPFSIAEAGHAVENHVSR